MEIATERLVLRELLPADCSAEYVGWLQDPAVFRFLETRHHRQSAADVAAFIEAVGARENEHLFGIFWRPGNRHIGNIKVGPIHPVHRLADVSLLIGARDCWGKGIASEAIAAISRLAFERLGVLKLSASMYATNLGSTAAFVKCGYQREGLRRSHYDLDGERCDLVELGLLPTDLGR